MSVKWQRNYVLTVQRVDGSIETIQYPLTLEFYIKRQIWSSINEAQFRIYNLNYNSRIGIRRDWQDFTTYRSLKLQAGYGVLPTGGQYPTIFDGNMLLAQSWKDSGSPNFITQMNGKDYVFSTVTGFVNTTIAPSGSSGTPKQAVINTLVNSVANTPATLGGGGSTGLGVGYITNAYQGQYYPRGRVLFGNAWQILQQETGNSCFIDNGNINILQNNDAFAGGIPTIDASTGLLSTPKKAEAYCEVEILFEPNVQAGQMVNLISQVEPDFNGQYKVIGFEHRGIISGSVNGRCTTKLLLYTLTQYNQIMGQGLPSI